MGKTRRFIDKKAAAHYQLVHRSQQDAAHEGSEAPSQFVLIPGPSSRQPQPLDGDERDGTRSRSGHEISSRGSGSHITPLGLPNDGYDYERHMKVMGGGTFVTPQGRVTSVPVPGGGGGGAAALPAEAMPSEELLDRQLESITISEEVMDEDIRAAISGTAAAPVEELDDDFVLQAAAADETGEEATGKSTFDFDAHIARLIAASERKVGLNRPGDNPNATPGVSSGASAAAAANGDDDSDGEFSSDLEANSTGGRRHDEPQEQEQEGGVEELFHRALEEYGSGSDDWGELGPEDEQLQLQGQRDLQTDGWANRCFDDFLDENKSLSWTVDDAKLAAAADKRKKTFAAAATAAVPAAEKGVAAAASRMAALSNAAAGQEAAGGGSSGGGGSGGVADMDADADAVGEGEAGEERDEGEGEGEEEEDEDVAALAQSFAYLGRAPQEKWDCESIVSTYSTLDNHPTTLSLGGEKQRRRGGGRGGPGGGSSSGSVGLAAAASALGPGPAVIGFAAAVAAAAAAGTAAGGQAGAGSGDANGSDSDGMADDSANGGDAKDERGSGGAAVVASARTRGESAEERRARKLLVKGEKRRARERKKESRKLFEEGAVAAARVAANPETAHRRSVFAYS